MCIFAPLGPMPKPASQRASQTDRQADRQTDGRALRQPAANICSSRAGQQRERRQRRRRRQRLSTNRVAPFSARVAEAPRRVSAPCIRNERTQRHCTAAVPRGLTRNAAARRGERAALPPPRRGSLFPSAAQCGPSASLAAAAVALRSGAGPRCACKSRRSERARPPARLLLAFACPSPVASRITGSFEVQQHGCALGAACSKFGRAPSLRSWSYFLQVCGETPHTIQARECALKCAI